MQRFWSPDGRGNSGCAETVQHHPSGSWTDDCPGPLTYLGGDPLDPASWRKEPAPVFRKAATIFGPGHAFFVEVDGQDYIICPAARSSQAGWARQIRAKPFTWNEDGSPNFGEPL